jgi:hypothetical protein
VIHALALAALTVTGAWSRPAVDSAVVYATVRNEGPKPVALVRVRSSAGTSAELHRSMAMTGGMTMGGAAMPAMGMAPVSKIAIPAHGTVTLKPGGDHVMVLGLRRPLSAGSSFPATFTFADGEQITVRVRVENRAL